MNYIADQCFMAISNKAETEKTFLFTRAKPAFHKAKIHENFVFNSLDLLFLRGCAGPHRQYKVLTTLVRFVFDRERRYVGIERKLYVLFLQRF